MRIRRKKWAQPELEASGYFIEAAGEQRGRWSECFARPGQPLHLELGCGKCVSTGPMAHDNRAINYVAVDIGRSMLGVARRNISAIYQPEPVDNLVLAGFNIMYIEQFFAPEDSVERIYINFCNPWNEKLKHKKRRLTHSRQLKQYREFMAKDGEIWFKTDDDQLFDESIEYFEESGFEITHLTRDLHASGFQPNYQSEHEKMFSAQGIPIKFLIGRKKDQ